jgi:hypothetical protein
MVHIETPVKMALGLALVGAAIKYYASSSTTLTADKKVSTNTLGDYTLYSGLALAALFQFVK